MKLQTTNNSSKVSNSPLNLPPPDEPVGSDSLTLNSAGVRDRESLNSFVDSRRGEGTGNLISHSDESDRRGDQAKQEKRVLPILPPPRPIRTPMFDPFDAFKKVVPPRGVD